MREIESRFPRIRWYGEAPENVRKSFRRAIEPYVDLLPSWCRALRVQVADRAEHPDGSSSVTAECETVTGTLAFTLPPEWEALGEREQELALVFWLAVDDVSRGLAAAAGPLVDAVRDLDKTAESGLAMGYGDLLPYVGSVALELARSAVGPRS